MPLTKKEKNKLTNGALVGGFVGACIGAPFLGAAAGSIINYNKKENKRKIVR